VTLGATLTASLLATLSHPSTWILALAAFLLRGGILIIAAPILVLPSAVGLGNVLAPSISAFVFGGLSPGLASVIGLTLVGVMAWLVLGGALAGATEAEAVRIIAADEDATAPAGRPIDPPRVGGRIWRIVIVRWAASLPLLVALTLGIARLVTVAYRELTVPSAVATPVAVRIVQGAPDALLGIAITWVLGGIVGALAVRHLVLVGSSVPDALIFALDRLVRHPLRSSMLALGPLASLIVVLAAALGGASVASGLVRAWLGEGAGIATAAIGLLVFLGVWTVGLVLVGVAAAWRTAAWTVDAAGTFGGATPGRPGDWNPPDPSATMADLRPPGVDPPTR